MLWVSRFQTHETEVPYIVAVNKSNVGPLVGLFIYFLFFYKRPLVCLSRLLMSCFIFYFF